MASILILPDAALKKVYRNLSSIEDIHNFARACNKTNNVIKLQDTYRDIMRSIIGTSPQHNFDLCLSRMLDLHSELAKIDSQAQAEPVKLNLPTAVHDNTWNTRETSLYCSVAFECEEGICKKCLTDERVDEILARYQGLKVLEELWMEQELNEEDLVPFASYFNNLAVDDITKKYRTLYNRDWHSRNNFRPSRLSDATKTYTRIDTDMRKRFHAAITSVWLLNEIRWVLTQLKCNSKPSTAPIEILGLCWTWIRSKTTIPTVACMDRLAMYKFLYQHLLPLHGAFLADRCSSELPLTFPSDLEASPYHRSKFFQCFLAAGSTYFQPPDIIDLVVRSRLSRTYPPNLLAIPRSTRTYQMPSTCIRYPAGLVNKNYEIIPANRLKFMEFCSIYHLRRIASAAIHKHITRHTPHVPCQLNSAGHYVIQDHTHTTLMADAINEYANYMDPKNQTTAKDYKDVVRIFPEQWDKVWWQVWWWAGSEDKGPMRIARWVRENGA